MKRTHIVLLAAALLVTAALPAVAQEGAGESTHYSLFFRLLYSIST